MTDADGSNPCDFSRKFDLCIIGSGAAGISIAHKLRNSGLRICILESSLVNEPQGLSAELVQRHETTPALAARAGVAVESVAGWNPDGHRFEDPVAQRLYEGELSDEMARIDPFFLTRSRIRVYGGTTNCWGGWTRPLSAVDFDRSDLDSRWKWPITRAELDPWYREAIKYCALEPLLPNQYDEPNLWPGFTTTPIAPIQPKTQGVVSGMFTVMYGESTTRQDGALDFQLVYGPALEAAGVCIERNANVRRLETNGDGSAVVRVLAQRIDRSGPVPKPGASFAVEADRYVLATGGIEGPRLLLLSRPGGLGNRSGTLGKNFMVHPLTYNACTFSGDRAVPQEIRRFYQSWPGWPIKGLSEPPKFFGTLMPTDQALRDNKIGNFRAILDFDSESEGRTGRINLNWEQGPSSKSQIVLSDNRKDLFGDPLVKLDWRMMELDQKTANQAVRLVIDELEAQGWVTRSEPQNMQILPGDHHMGATKMSTHPLSSYVNSDCRLHDVGNLYVASSSVFTTGGVANPTLTIIALALRLADHLRA